MPNVSGLSDAKIYVKLAPGTPRMLAKPIYIEDRISLFIDAAWCGARASLVRVHVLTATSPPVPVCRPRTTCEKAPAAMGPSVSKPKMDSGSDDPRRAAVPGRDAAVIGRDAGRSD